MPTMPFGKYRGHALHTLPDAYLDWLLCLEHLRPGLAADIQVEWRRRHLPPEARTPSPGVDLPAQCRPFVDEFLAGGFRACAKLAHPDVGGSHEAMLAVNDLITFLRDVLR